ncbi:MAG: ChrR family anti-sigma-E factor [Alphaproteobacteria bacterium]|nr:ChrR family anti-sigma-E factor [Alphaproteobacteria bacterium]
MPQHHPDDALLIEYANGSLSEAKSLLVATHTALCPRCRSAVKAGEATGALMAFGDDVPVEVGPAPDVASVQIETAKASASLSSLMPVPDPLRGYLGGEVSRLNWVPVLRGMREYALPAFAGREAVRLLAIEAGRRMPSHTHLGQELTLVLQGSFVDATGSYAKGDVATADGSIDHQPRAGAGEMCLCLAVEDAPLRLTGFSGILVGIAAVARRLAGR